MSNIILRLPLPPEGINPVYPLDDPSLKDQLSFLKLKTGIQDEKKLKEHICSIHEKTCKIFSFPCVFNFDFVRAKVVNHPIYRQAVEAAKNQPTTQKIFIDFGAAMGSDLRQVVHDGWKREDVLGIDVDERWIGLAYDLFKDSDRRIPYFIGDIFDVGVFDASKPKEETVPETLDLFSLKELNSLKGRATIISAFFLFHLFGGEDQEKLARYLALLLSNQPGSTIMGSHRGSEDDGLHSLAYAQEAHWYSYSAESWTALWEKCFEPGSVKIVSELKESTTGSRYEYIHGERKVLWLYWSVTRL